MTKTLVIWDVFRGHLTSAVKLCLDGNDIVTINHTHLLSPLDLTVDKAIKQQEQKEFSLYYTKCVTAVLTRTPDIDPAEIKIDVRKVVMRPLHARTDQDL